MTILAISLLVTAALPTQAAPTLFLVIRVRISSVPELHAEREFRLTANRTTVVALDLGEDLDGQPVWIAGKRSSDTYRVLERYRTSLTITGEGPHMDLLDWKHYDSPWEAMQRQSSARFLARTIAEYEANLFPRVSRSEMFRAVDLRARRGWSEAAELVRECSGPNSHPCGVGVSSRYFRVQCNDGGTWVTIGTVEVRIPMGC